MIYPKPLDPGSTIGIAAPSGGVRDKVHFEEGIRLLHELGYETKFPRNLWPGDGYLADNDFNRFQEFIALWNDNECDAVMAARGGYGCLRIAHDIVDGLDLSRAKMLIGFSDITLLHSLINQRCGLVSLHGPVVTSLRLLSPESIKSFAATLKNDIRKWSYTEKCSILRQGSSISGMTAGGNLSTIISTLGTKLMPVWRDKIVFLEDTAESTYRIDRMLTQLKMAGILDGLGALILGDFSHGLDLDRNGVVRHHEAIWKRALDLVEDRTVVWADFPIGHGKVNYTFPLGVEMTIDGDKGVMYAEQS